MVIEISFPRGGRKPISKTDRPAKKFPNKEFDLFGINRSQNDGKRKRKSIKQTKEVTEPLGKDIEATCAELITYRTIQDGMILLGCIRQVQKMALDINLPGRIFGRVMVTHISAAYTQLLHLIVDDTEPEGYKSLRQIFSPGQNVAVKVISIDGNDKFRIGLSMMPQDVNSQLHHSSLITGMIIWGAISSKEEHGYVVDLGVNNSRAFLSKVFIDEGREYAIGELTWFAVQKCTVTAVATTVALNALSKKVNTMKIIKETSLDNLKPGMKVDFTVSKLVTNGLEGKFLDDFTGYINQSQFNDLFESTKTYSEEDILEARVMYIMPVTKLAYLTLRSLENQERGKIVDGTLTHCTVHSITKGGLYLRLDDNQKGFVSYQRLKTQIKLNSEVDELDILKKTYPNDSKHKCRVLSFDYFEQVYICSLEKNLTKNMIFSENDVNVGQEVSATIKEIQRNGLLVKVGNLNCYIKNIHLSDAVLDSYANIKNKYKVDQVLKARIWMVKSKEDTCQLTMKPSFLKSKSILTSYDKIQLNKQYLGIVKQISTSGLLVEFFGSVFGWVPKSHLSFERVKMPEIKFKIGQIVNCTVLKFHEKTKRLTLSLKPPKIKTSEKLLKLGQHVNAVIINIIDDGIEVKIDGLDIPAFVPVMHITKFSSLANALKGTYKIGNKITNLVCVNSFVRIPILSMRDTSINEDAVPDLEDLEKNTILPCSVQEFNGDKMLLQTPIKNYRRFVTVPAGNIIKSGNVEDISIKKNEFIMAKVLNILENRKQPQQKTVLASTKLEQCWNFNLNDCVGRVTQYLQEIERIKTHFKSLQKPLANLNLGEIVSGVIQEEVGIGGYIVDLANGSKAIVHSQHVTEKLSVGSEVKGVVLWLDFANDFAEISLCSKLMTRINSIQDGSLDISVDNLKPNPKAHAEILLVKEDVALVVLKGHQFRRQIAYIPAKLHSNDFFLGYSQYIIGEEIKIEISKVADGIIIGLSKNLIKTVTKRCKKDQLLIRQLTRPQTDLETIKVKDKLKTQKRKLKEGVNGNNESKKVRKDVVQEKKERANGNEVNKVQENEVLTTSKSKNKKDKNKKNTNKLQFEEEITKKENSKNDKKRKADDQVVNTNETDMKKNKKQKIEIISVQEIKPITSVVSGPILSGISNFWNIPKSDNVDEESSGDEDKEQELLTKQQKKKKMTPAERAEAARLEEERIRNIEMELADSEATPKTADQFDRLVLATPNNSMLWINYMAFHLEATEIEKARAIAQKALNTIIFREEQEKLNVWLALLNLENRYGTKESFDSVLEEAVQKNDSLTVYLQALNILADSKKTSELVELLNNVTKKFKQDFKMWTGAADACYTCDLKEQARNLMQRALKSLDEKQHVNLIVQFAFMESRYKDLERAEALLEKVLASYPRRVDVWTSYVELLVKNDRIHIARNVLQRAVGQKLPARKMKTIFSKYVQFETKYGDENKVKNVRELAANYVRSALK